MRISLKDKGRELRAIRKHPPETNAHPMVIGVVERTTWWSSEPIPVVFSIVIGAGLAQRDCLLHWKAPTWGSAGSLPVPELKPGEVNSVGPTVIPAASTHLPSSERVSFELLDSQGRVLARNSLLLNLSPQRVSQNFPEVEEDHHLKITSG